MSTGLQARSVNQVHYIDLMAGYATLGVSAGCCQLGGLGMLLWVFQLAVASLVVSLKCKGRACLVPSIINSSTLP